MFISKFVRLRLRTAERFQAADPWNGRRPSEFSIEVSANVPAHLRERSPRWMWAGPEVYGLRSEIDGVERPLPEALTELWSSRRVPASALPALLREMEPTLHQPDFQPILHRQFGRWLAILLPIALLSFWGFVVTRASYYQAASAALRASQSGGALAAAAPGGAALPIVLVLLAFAAGCGALVCLIVAPAFALRGRERRKQMQWALERLGGSRG
jgi:hypothetical protein